MQLLAFLNADGILIDFLVAGTQALEDDLRQVVVNRHIGSVSLLRTGRLVSRTKDCDRLVQNAS